MRSTNVRQAEGALQDGRRHGRSQPAHTTQPFVRRGHACEPAGRRIEALACDLGMSVSGFHHHFRSVAAMTPLQYQKQLRLQEARRLMVGKGFDPARAGYRVGYRDASHFTREHKRLFGVPPMRDVERLRETTTELGEQYPDRARALSVC